MPLQNVTARQNLQQASVSSASVCSAHPEVLLASLLLAQEQGQTVLIEATSNQVNQFGGYTGMQAADFISYVLAICRQHGIAENLVRFGGDHLGPQAWREQAAEVAMGHARELVASYVKAGFRKIHLDCSEGCLGETAQVGDQVSAERAAELAQVCEASSAHPETLSYVIGTEVPPPGGTRADEDGNQVVPTSAASARATMACHEQAFASRGLHAAWGQVAALVVQPGLEFSPDSVHHFDCASPDLLASMRADYPHLAFEAHSTDYQKPAVFAELAQRHFTVMKVGPALTYAYRQAIYALDFLSAWLGAERCSSARLPDLMESLMQAETRHWRKHYSGDATRLQQLRHFSYADRIRYYWALPAASAAVQQLLATLSEQAPPIDCLLEQYFSLAAIERAAGLERRGYRWAQALVLAQIQLALQPYFLCGSRQPGTQ